MNRVQERISLKRRNSLEEVQPIETQEGKPLSRAQRKAKIKYKALGKPKEDMRRCKTIKTEEINGVFYTTYLHFTKGIKKRRVVTNTIKPLYMVA